MTILAEAELQPIQDENELIVGSGFGGEYVPHDLEPAAIVTHKTDDQPHFIPSHVGADITQGEARLANQYYEGGRLQKIRATCAFAGALVFSPWKLMRYRELHLAQKQASQGYVLHGQALTPSEQLRRRWSVARRLRRGLIDHPSDDLYQPSVRRKREAFNQLSKDIFHSYAIKTAGMVLLGLAIKDLVYDGAELNPTYVTSLAAIRVLQWLLIYMINDKWAGDPLFPSKKRQ